MILDQVSAGRHIKSALSRHALGRIVLSSKTIYVRRSDVVKQRLHHNIRHAERHLPA